MNCNGSDLWGRSHHSHVRDGAGESLPSMHFAPCEVESLHCNFCPKSTTVSPFSTTNFSNHNFSIIFQTRISPPTAITGVVVHQGGWRTLKTGNCCMNGSSVIINGQVWPPGKQIRRLQASFPETTAAFFDSDEWQQSNIARMRRAPSVPHEWYCWVFSIQILSSWSVPIWSDSPNTTRWLHAPWVIPASKLVT